MSSPHADAIAAELQRRATHLDELRADPAASMSRIDHVRGEIIGLQGALGIILGGTVPGGTADKAAFTYYQQWLDRQDQAG